MTEFDSNVITQLHRVPTPKPAGWPSPALSAGSPPGQYCRCTDSHRRGDHWVTWRKRKFEPAEKPYWYGMATAGLILGYVNIALFIVAVCAFTFLMINSNSINGVFNDISSTLQP